MLATYIGISGGPGSYREHVYRDGFKCLVNRDIYYAKIDLFVVQKHRSSGVWKIES